MSRGYYRVGKLNKLLNHVMIVKHNRPIQHYLTCQQPCDLHCLQKKYENHAFYKTRLKS